MKLFKKLLLAVIAVGTVTTLAACSTTSSGGGQSNGQSKYKIGVTVYGQGNFITQGQEGMKAYAKAKNIDLLWNSANNDVNTQASQVEQMITAGVDAIIIVPVQFDSLEPQLQEAKSAGIPVIAVNTTVKSSKLLTTSVVPDDLAAGSGNAQIMADALGGKGNVVIMQCVLGSSYEIARTKGMEQTFAKYPGIKVIAKGEAANNQREPAAARMSNWLSAFSNINGVAACGDDPGLGALQAIKEAGKTIPISGIDGVADGLSAVKNGTFAGTMLQHGRVELATGLAVALKVVERKKYLKAYPFTMKAITRQNVDHYLEHVVTKSAAFVETLPKLVDQNLADCTSAANCDLANETLK